MLTGMSVIFTKILSIKFLLTKLNNDLKNMIQNIFKKSEKIKSESPEINLVLRLMFEIALSDGNLDKSELQILRSHAKKLNIQQTSANSIIKGTIEEIEQSSSLYPTIQKINNEYTNEHKILLLKTLWEVVMADGMIDHYEESLYFKIANLIKIKRSKANEIKQSFV